MNKLKLQPSSLMTNGLASKLLNQKISMADLYDVITGKKKLEKVDPRHKNADGSNVTIPYDLEYHTEEYRRLGDKKLKAKMPAINPASYIPTGHAAADAIYITGIGYIDVDGIPKDKVEVCFDKAANDPHTLMVYRTLSGKGLRIFTPTGLLNIDGETPEEMQKRYHLPWLAAQKYYDNLLGIKPDESTGGINKCSTLSYDPKAYYNPEAQPIIEQTMVNKQPDECSEGEEISDEKLFEYVQLYLNYVSNTFNVPGNHHNYAVSCAQEMYKLDFTQAAAFDLIDSHLNGVPSHEAKSIVKSVYKNAEGNNVQKIPVGVLVGTLAKRGIITLHRNEKPKRKPTKKASRKITFEPEDEGKAKKKSMRQPLATIAEIKAYLDEHIELVYNTIFRKYYYHPQGEEKWVEFTDRIFNDLYCNMKLDDINVSVNDLRAVLQSNYAREFQPFIDYFNSLPAWDGTTDYIAELASYVHLVPDEDESPEEAKDRFQLYLKRWLVALVRPLIDMPGVNQTMLVFIGAQGVHKTRFCCALLPPELSEYIKMSLPTTLLTGDNFGDLCRMAVILLDEFDSIQRTQLPALKQMITMDEVERREPYARHSEKHRRISSFVATGNDINFLTDPTGSRRNLVVQVERIDDPEDRPINYTGVYSQALALAKSDFRCWFNDDEIKIVNQHNEQFQVERPEESLLVKYYDKGIPGESDCKLLSPSEMLEHIHPLSSFQITASSLGKAATRLGYKKKHFRTGSKYYVRERSAEEMSANEIPEDTRPF